jgi:cytochrome c-type biogenesis protein CcsB
MDVPFFFGALVLYGVGTLAYWLLLSMNRRLLARLATGATAGGLTLHTIALLLCLAAAERLPLSSGHEALSFFAWFMVVVYLGLEFRFRHKVMGAFVLPIVLLTVAAASTLQTGTGDLSPAVKNSWIWIHVTLILLGYAAFAITCAAAMMYLLQDRCLKSKSPGAIQDRLPPLEFLDLIGHRALLTGFPLLTLGLLIGVLQARAAWGPLLAWDPTRLVSLLAWVLYAVLLHTRLMAGWRGRKAALLAVVSFIALLVTFVGVSLFLGRLHR